VALSGNYAYLLCFSGLKIIDVSDPENPALVSSINAGNEGVFIAGNYAYVAGPIFKVVDISDPLNPFQVSSFTLPSQAYDVVVSNSYAFLAVGSAGIMIFDITNPYLPIVVGNYDTSGEAKGIAVHGTSIYVADFSNIGVYNFAPALDNDDGTLPSVGEWSGLDVYPNPFRGDINIELKVYSPGWVRMEIFNVKGQLVESLYTGEKATGTHYLAWDGFDMRGRRLPKGIYILRNTHNGRTISKKIVKLNNY
jgi:hypothetical protein